MPGISVTLRIKGVTELRDKLNRPLQEFIRSAAWLSANEMLNRFQTYPPETQANNPSRRRWYVRLVGSRWRRKDGSIGMRNNSERLYYQWHIEHSGALGAKFYNKASYAAWVQGDKQTRVMKRIGWKTYRDVMTASMKRKIDSFLQNTVQWWIEGRSPSTKK